MSGRTALITGANGQDGRYLGRFLSASGYRVTGVVRGPDRVVEDGVGKRWIPARDENDWKALLREARPDELYHLAGDSYAGAPTHGPAAMLEANVMFPAHLLEWVQEICPSTRVFLAGSAAVFGEATESPQSETTARRANSFYGSSKLMLHALAEEHRRRGLHVSVGILYNHESPLRPARFVTRKITAAAAAIAAGRESRLVLGNLDVVRDWGHAADHVRGMHSLLQLEEPEDRIIATGTGRTVRQFCEAAFSCVGLDYRDYVEVSKKYWREAEPFPLVGSSERLHRETGWSPEIPFESIVSEMVSADRNAVLVNE